MAQNITSAGYKGVGYLSDTMEPVVVPNEPSMVSKPHYKAKQAVQ